MRLLALDGDGAFVPTLAAAAIVRRLAATGLPVGAAPCVGTLALADFQREMAGLKIRTRETP